MNNQKISFTKSVAMMKNQLNASVTSQHSVKQRKTSAMPGRGDPFDMREYQQQNVYDRQSAVMRNEFDIDSRKSMPIPATAYAPYQINFDGYNREMATFAASQFDQRSQRRYVTQQTVNLDSTVKKKQTNEQKILKIVSQNIKMRSLIGKVNCQLQEQAQKSTITLGQLSFQKKVQFPKRENQFDGRPIVRDCENLVHTFKPTVAAGGTSDVEQDKDTPEEEQMKLKDMSPDNRFSSSTIYPESSRFDEMQLMTADSEPQKKGDSPILTKKSSSSRKFSNFLKKKKKPSAISQVQDLYETFDESQKYDPEKCHWDILREYRENNIKYGCIKDIEGYSFKAEDEQDDFLKDLVTECKLFFKMRINDSNQNQRETEINILSHFEVNQITGEKFLRLVIREWKTSYDPEVIILNKNNERQTRSKNRKNVNKDYEIHSLKFMKFDEELQIFEEEDEILYDISQNFLQLDAGSFNNDFFLTKNEHTYYFKKDKQKHGFQLYRHSYGTPFQKFPVDNNQFPMHDNRIMEDYFIKINPEKNLHDVQIIFLKNATNNYSLRNDQLSEEIDFLDNQYVMVKDKIYAQSSKAPVDQDSEQNTDIYIYKVSTGQLFYDSTKDQTLDKKFQEVQCGFFIKNQDQDHDDVDECLMRPHFIIKCKLRDYIIHQVKTGPQTQSERSPNFLRHRQHMIMPQHMQINLERTEQKFCQAFFFNKQNCQVNFIFPFHSSKEENISSDIKNKQEEVIKYISQYFLNNERGKIVYQEREFAFIANDQFKEIILSDINPRNGYRQNDEFISTSDMILKVNSCENVIHYWCQQPNYEFISYREIMTQMQDDKDLLLQKIILEQYSLDNQNQSGNNYNLQDTLGLYQNQYLNRVYLTTRQGIFLEHHKVYLQDNPTIEIPDLFIVMDLGQNEGGELSIFQLYAPRICAQSVKDLKLVTYHISYEQGLVAFFFIQRNCDKQSGNYATNTNQSGVEFMVVHKLDKLVQYAENFKRFKRQQFWILDKNIPIFIFGHTVKDLIYTNFDRDIIMKFQDNSKAAAMMASTLVHEMVYDPENPCDNIVPFLFSSEISRKPTPIFQWYFCFLDLNQVQDFIESNTIELNKPRTISFHLFCDVFTLKEVNDPVSVRNSHDVLYENSRTRDCPLFCRSAQWTSDTSHIQVGSGVDFEDQVQDVEQLEYTYSTKFQIGFVMSPQDTQMFEIIEFIVSLNQEQIFRNLDLLDIFDKKIDEVQSRTKIRPYQMQHIMPSASANEAFIGQQKFWENHRLVPKINNNGKISGTHLMLNLYMIFQENISIVSDPDIIKKEKKNIGENMQILLQNAGQEVLFIRPKAQNKGLIYLESGRQYEVPLSILVDEKDNLLSKVMDPKPYFVYQIINTSDTEIETNIQFKTPIMQVGYKQYALDGQSGNLITLCTSRMNKQIVYDQVFDRNTMQYFLHKQQTDLITTSIPSFQEVYKSKYEQKTHCYFQFRFLLLGRSFCSIDYPSFQNSISRLTNALDHTDLHYSRFTAESALFTMFDLSTDDSESKSETTLEMFFEMLQIQPQMNFMANWNFETFVQKSLDNNLNRPLLFLIEHLINQKDEASYKTILIQDLPQLLTQDQVNIFQFLNEYHPSEYDLNALMGNAKQDGCRLETPLENPDLPIVGDPYLKSTLVQNFKCVYNMREEIQTFILNESRISQMERYKEMQEMLQENQEIPLETRTEIKHNFINFIPMINKIKIDLLTKRPASQMSYTTYLKDIKVKPEEFDEINDLFLANLFSYNENNLDFFKQTTIQKIINRQFEYTAKFIKTLLIIYSVGFVIPQILNIYLCAGVQEMYISNEQIVLQMVLYVMRGVTQIFFLTLEYAELQDSGFSAYFQNGWNYMDSTQYIFFMIQVYLKCHQLHKKKHTAEQFWLELVTIICLLQSAAKFLQLIRYNENFCFLVQMLMEVSVDIYPFLIVFFTFNGVFSLSTLILEGGYDSEPYQYMGQFPVLINLLQTFRNSIGDLTEPIYGQWITGVNEYGLLDNYYQYAVMAVTWFLFISNIFIMQIVLLNFLIAEVSMTYEKVKNLGPCLLFQKKQELNHFIQKVCTLYGKNDAFKALIFVSPRTIEGEEDQFIELKTFMKEQIQFEMGKMKMEVIPNLKKIGEQCTANHNLIQENETQMNKVQDRMNEMHKEMSGLSKMVGEIHGMFRELTGADKGSGKRSARDKQKQEGS